jgi:hypothetical protein
MNAKPSCVTPAEVGVQESRGVIGLGTPNAIPRVWEPFPPPIRSGAGSAREGQETAALVWTVIVLERV